MKCHVITPFHTIPDPEGFSHDAFCQKALKLVKMLKIAGYDVVEYANEGSKSAADEKVQILSRKEFDANYPPLQYGEFHWKYANIGERGAPTFRARTGRELLRRVEDGDIVCHTFGVASNNLVPMVPNAFHVESGIGYNPDPPFGCFRIFESEAWKHYTWGKYHQEEERYGRHYSWVIPNSFDGDDWPFCPAGDNEGYILFMGRITTDKGMPTIVELIKELPGIKFKIAGQGNFEQCIGNHVNGADNVEFLGSVTGRARADLVGRAKCMLMPTDYIEPFGSSGVEALMTGTPVLSTDFGAFTEIVENRVNGFRCKTLGDWLEAVGKVDRIDREAIASQARQRYTFEAGAEMYKKAFSQIQDLADRGWYTKRSYTIL